MITDNFIYAYQMVNYIRFTFALLPLEDIVSYQEHFMDIRISLHLADVIVIWTLKNT